MLSPCVLPILPIVGSASLSGSRFGPLALALGLALSFAVSGTLLAALGGAIGLDPDWLRPVGAAALMLVGVTLVWKPASDLIARWLQPIADLANTQAGRMSGGPVGQFGLGALLGLAWSPCVGPTLGVASALAVQSGSLLQAATIMLAFGLGAGIPLALAGYGGRSLSRGGVKSMVTAGTMGRKILGYSLFAVGLLILSGLDRSLEAFLVSVSPQWLTDLTTRY
jgi:cytochrome c-type biogenesis protein